MNWQQVLQINPTEVVLLAALVAVSAFASSSETAFFSLNRFQMRRIRDRYRESYERIRTLLARPSRLLVLILLINEITNITISSLVTQILQGKVGLVLTARGQNNANLEWLITTFLSMCITLPTLVLLGEITPKVIAARMNRIFAIVNGRVLITLYRLLYPILWAFDGAISFILRKFKAEGRDQLSKVMSVLSEEDLMLLMEEGHREGTVDPRERRMIANVFEFDDSTVAEVMSPIANVFSISAGAKVTDVLHEVRLQKYSRVPVYQKNKRNLVGVLYVKDLLPLRNHPKLSEIEVRTLMARPMVVGSNVRLSVLFRRFKEAKTHIAVVVNRTHPAGQPSLPSPTATAAGATFEGEAVGIVTMEDVLESIFGEIADERDVR